MTDVRCPYEVLGVPSSATATEIRTAFHAHCLRLHPDKRGGDVGGVGELAAVRAAFDILGDAESRAKFDATAAARDSMPFVIFTDVQESELRSYPRCDDFLVHDCRCGGRFSVANDEVDDVDIVPCDTCSLALRIVR